MDQALSVYLPMDRRHSLATGIPLPDRTRGAALFADVSGFTSLTEALTSELGPRRGAEELPRQLNLVYNALIGEVDRYGGSVIGFAGDAITCWFDQDSGLRATACGLAMQEAMQPFAAFPLPTAGTTSLAVKVAIVRGTVRRFLVGDPQIQLIDTLAGATLSRMATVEQVTEKGKVGVDALTAKALGEALDIERWYSDPGGTHVAVVRGLREMVLPHPWPSLPSETLTSEQLRPWLLPVVYERLQAGQGEFLTELRPAVALFLRFGDIDYDEDPEAGEKLDLYIRWIQSILAQYEGTLVQLTIGEKGSYLYATFGVPVAHEDDARRAALAALALRTPPDALAFITDTQIGLTRGMMRTGAYGGSTRRTYGVLGDEVNLAARLMQHARPGQIIASGRVQAATASLFRWRTLGAIHVKGRREPLSASALLGPIPASTIHLAEPTYTLPMIGRQAQLTLIEEKMSLARQGQGQVVGITAEAGMGKSRLVAEAIRHAQQLGLPGYGGECQSYGMNTPYLVWQPIWRAFFGLEASDPPARQAQQVAHALAALEPYLLPRLPLLGPVLGLSLPDNDLTRSLSPELRKASREALLVDLLKARARSLRAEQGAVLLVLEDCHWLDAASHDLLEAISRAIWNEAVLILLAYRPTELERLEAPRVSSLPYFTLLPLTELTQPEAIGLLTNRLQQLGAPQAQPPAPALLMHLAERAQGNPFYLEELLNYLHDQGLDPYDPESISQLELPTSLHRLILSRIDRLTEPQKVTLKVASIIGRLFRFDWLLGYYPALGDSGTVKRDLDALSRLDLTPLERAEPERIYLFKHIVTREVAYESLPYATRAQLHEQLAAFLEERDIEAVEGYLDLLAYHYERSENLTKKRLYLRRAGETAQESYANSAAQDYYERLLPLLDDPDERLDIHVRLGTVLEGIGQWDRAEAHYQAAVALAPGAQQPEAQARSALALGRLYQNWTRLEEAQPWLSQALEHWEALGNAHGISQTLAELGVVASVQGNFGVAQDYLERSQAICQAQGDLHGLSYILDRLATVVLKQGHHELAQARYAESLALSEKIGNKWGIGMALKNLGNMAFRYGHWEEARAWYEKSLSRFQEVGDRQSVGACLNNLGCVAYVQGDYETAQTLCEQGVAMSREIGNKRGIIIHLYDLGVVAWSQGRYAVAQELGEESLILSRQTGAKPWTAAALNLLGAVNYRQQEIENAQRYYEEGLRLAHEIRDKWQTLSNLVGLVGLVSPQANLVQMRQATRLMSVVEAECRSMGARLEPIIQTFYDEVLGITQTHLSAADFAAAWDEGQAMRLDEAVAVALAMRDQ